MTEFFSPQSVAATIRRICLPDAAVLVADAFCADH
jgi:hypothetical protein